MRVSGNFKESSHSTSPGKTYFTHFQTLQLYKCVNFLFESKAFYISAPPVQGTEQHLLFCNKLEQNTILATDVVRYDDMGHLLPRGIFAQ